MPSITLRNRVRLQRSAAVAVAAMLVFILAPAPAFTEPLEPPTVKPGFEPSLTGSGIVGGQLSVSVGQWEGTQPISHTIQWQQSVDGNEPWHDVGAATSHPHLYLDHVHAGLWFRAQVTASNSAGSSVATTPAAGPVPAQAPYPTVFPDLPQPYVGVPVTATPGVWHGTPTIEIDYQWMRWDAGDGSDPFGGQWMPIAGATEQTYVPVEDDGYLMVELTARNDGGAVPFGTPSREVSYLAPSLVEGPSIVGDAKVGLPLEVDLGEWEGSPATWTFEWYSCIVEGVCDVIDGASSSTYVPTAVEVGTRLQVLVTASNPAGTSASYTDVSDVVEDTAVPPPAGTESEPPPVDSESEPPADVADGSVPEPVTLPEVSGVLAVGELLTFSSGIWSSVETVTFSHQWQLWDGSVWEDVGDTPLLRVPVEAAGRQLRVTVTATNVYGSSVASSTPVLIAGEVPEPLTGSAPVVAGVAAVGGELSAAVEPWTGGVGDVSYQWSWERCTADVSVCSTVDGASSDVYAVGAGDVGHVLRAVLVVSDATDDVVVYSEVSGVVVGSPGVKSDVVAPSSGDVVVVSGVGFKPGSVASVRISHFVDVDVSDGVGSASAGLTGSSLAEVVVGGDGSFSVEVVVPADVVGAVVLAVDGVDVSGGVVSVGVPGVPGEPVSASHLIPCFV